MATRISPLHDLQSPARTDAATSQAMIEQFRIAFNEKGHPGGDPAQQEATKTSANAARPTRNRLRSIPA
jgi:hypothetical protein